MSNETKPPNPGSAKAKSLGCKCPRLDNAHGQGYMGGVRDKNGGLVFVVRLDCPMHGKENGGNDGQ